MRFLPAVALVVALAATPAAASPERERLTRERVDGLLAGLAGELERGERLRDEDARSLVERVERFDRCLRLLGLAAGHLLRGTPGAAAETVHQVEGLLGSFEPDRRHYAGELMASEAESARSAAGKAREAIERGDRSRALAAIRVAGRYTTRARDVAAASVLPLFDE